MMELLAVPAWDAPQRRLEEWIAALAAHGLEATIVREAGEIWLDVPAPRVRGYVVIEDGHVTAINFELPDPDFDAAPDAEPARRLVEAAAADLHWELHLEEDDDDVEED